MPTQKKISAKDKKTVLFIDDETKWLKTVKMTLEGEPVKIVTADSPEAALKKLQHAAPDLILSDVRMPMMNGFDLFMKVKDDPKLKNVPYVFMSSIDDFDAMRTAKEIGADGYIEKPFDMEKIRSIVNDLITRFKHT
jgi:response regulator RpfG family c-di-GMP phosphodiesterase